MYLVENIERLRERLPVTYSRSTWAYILMNTVVKAKEDIYLYDLKDVASDFYAHHYLSNRNWRFLQNKAQDSLDYDMMRMGRDLAPRLLNNRYVYYSIRCNEWYNKWNEHISLIDGRLVIKSVAEYKSPCEKFMLKNNKIYDPKDFQVSEPIVYFQGDLDPQTPIFGAIDHYETQENSRFNTFIEVKNAGHSPLRNQLRPCFKDIWIEIFKPVSNFNNVLNEDGYCKVFGVNFPKRSRYFEPVI